MNQSDRSPRASGAIGGAPIFNAPMVAVLVIGLLVLSHFAIAVSPKGARAWMQAHGAVSPWLLVNAIGRGQIFKALAPLVTHVFIHASIAHLLLNSVWLLAFGSPVANRLNMDRGEIHGGLSFILLFILSGVFGGLTYVAAHSSEYTLLIGASGGVSGLFGALVRFAFYRPDGSGRRFAKLTDRSVLIWSASFVFLNVAIGLFGSLIFGGDNDIAWEAHLGGYAFGLLAFPLVDRLRR